MDDQKRDQMHRTSRRSAILAMTGLVGGGSGYGRTNDASPSDSKLIDASAQFGAVGDGKTDDTDALERAIAFGSSRQWPIVLPPGVYVTTRSLYIPSNTMIRGSSYGLGFGCRLEPQGCPALVIGGKTTTFHSSIENLMIWPKGPASDFVILVDNSYSIKFHNIRIHNSHPDIKRAAIVLAGDKRGHGRSIDILWERVIVRNDGPMGSTAVLAEPGCGTHRFYQSCFENYVTLLEWQGGQLDLFGPYTERAGRYAVHCNNTEDASLAHVNIYGGSIGCSESAVGCAIGAFLGAFNSIGTLWAPDASRAIYVYDAPKGVATFSGVEPNFSGSGVGQCIGIERARGRLRFPDYVLQSALHVQKTLQGRETIGLELMVSGARPDLHQVRATLNAGKAQVLVSTSIAAPNLIIATIHNPTDRPVELSGELLVACSLA